MTHPDYLLYLPLAKAAKIALDSIENISQFYYKQGVLLEPITQFYIAGISKRGAATWLVTAFEGQNCINNQSLCRLIGSAPIVYDYGNFSYALPGTYEQLGGW